MLPPCVVLSANTISETLKQQTQQGKRLLEPIKSFSSEHRLPLNILEDHNVTNEAEVHRHEDDLWMCLEGEVTFVHGGTMLNPWAKKLPNGELDTREIKAKEIAGGETSILRTGDWLYIPAGQPHLHHTQGTARIVIIKLPAKKEVPLAEVPGWHPKST